MKLRRALFAVACLVVASCGDDTQEDVSSDDAVTSTTAAVADDPAVADEPVEEPVDDRADSSAPPAGVTTVDLADAAGLCEADGFAFNFSFTAPLPGRHDYAVLLGGDDGTQSALAVLDGLVEGDQVAMSIANINGDETCNFLGLEATASDETLLSLAGPCAYSSDAFEIGLTGAADATQSYFLAVNLRDANGVIVEQTSATADDLGPDETVTVSDLAILTAGNETVTSCDVALVDSF